MHFGFDETQSMIRESVAAFARDQVREQAMSWNEKGGSAVEAARALGELGLLGILTPEQHGGAELGATELVIALEELARADAGLAAIVATHNVMALCPLLKTPGDFVDIIEALASGNKLGCGAVTPGAVIGAAHADVFVSGGTPTRAVDLTNHEVTPVTMLGLRTCGAGKLDELLIQDELDATSPYIIGLARLSTAAIAIGITTRALEAGVTYSMERKQFGKPVGRFQPLQWMTADAATELSAARLLLHKAAWAHDCGKKFEDTAARASQLAVRYCRATTDRALQMHGGYGYTEDFVVERLYRDAYTLHALAGRTDEARIAVAQALAATAAG